MASTSTSELQSVTGYIHNVSSLKQGPQKNFLMLNFNRKTHFAHYESSGLSYMASSKRQKMRGKSVTNIIILTSTV